MLLLLLAVPRGQRPTNAAALLLAPPSIRVTTTTTLRKRSVSRMTVGPGPASAASLSKAFSRETSRTSSLSASNPFPVQRESFSHPSALVQGAASATAAGTSAPFASNATSLSSSSSSSLSSVSAAQKRARGPGAPATTIPRVVLKRTRQSLAFRNGNPLVFAKAIECLECSQNKDDGGGDLALGDLVEVVVPADDAKGSKPSSAQFTSLGYGVYNPHSLYRVRILCHRYLHPALHNELKAMAASTTSLTATAGEEESAEVARDVGIGTIVRHHLRTSLLKRLAIQLPNSQTSAFRWVNGEGDSLSGLAVELLVLPDAPAPQSGAHAEPSTSPRALAVVMSSAGWCQVHRTSIERAIWSCLSGFSYGDVNVVWKTTPSRLVQDGCAGADLDKTGERSVQQAAAGEESGDATEKESAVVVRENGVLYKVYPWSDGQKTSVYCDQRENRHMVAQLCQNKRVLDLCCYHGGFALNALLNGGATSCTAVDSSQAAIDALHDNVLLNSVDPTKLEAICGDITAFLQQTCHGNPDRQYDVVVLDPPKLAPTTSGLDKAKRKYHGLNRDAIKVINEREGGLLLTCTCSAAMTQRDGGRYFLDMVSGAALAAGRCVTLLRVTGAASCHTQSPVAYPAGSYLTAALFYVHPTGEVHVKA